MRRLVLLFVSSLVLAGLYAVGAPANAVDPLTGQLVNASDTDVAIAGATVRLRTVTEAGPGAVVVTDVTDADGDFSLDAGATPDDKYYVEVIKPDYQSGFVGGAPGDTNYVQTNIDFARTYGPHVSLGDVLIIPGFVRGIVVNSATGNRVRGIKVSVRNGSDLDDSYGADVTNRRGVFRIEGVECEDNCALRFIGHPRGYENGYRACPGTVVATWDDACASPIGKIGKVRLDHL